MSRYEIPLETLQALLPSTVNAIAAKLGRDPKSARRSIRGHLARGSIYAFPVTTPLKCIVYSASPDGIGQWPQRPVNHDDGTRALLDVSWLSPAATLTRAAPYSPEASP